MNYPDFILLGTYTPHGSYRLSTL